MTVAKLPDELLQMILMPSLTISRQQFVSASLTAFGENDTVSSASVLLVCKRWLRVATPILYETLIIRSTGQSRSLANVFRHNPAFAKYVKKVRLEGAYAFLDCVLPSCKNLVTLVLLLHIYSDTNVTGLCRALPSINPAEVILRDEWPNINSNLRLVFKTFCNAIPTWKNLTSFDYPYSGHRGVRPLEIGATVARKDYLMDALAQSKSLRTLYSDGLQFLHTQWKRLAKASPIDFKFYFRSDDPIAMSFVKAHLHEIHQDKQLSKYSIEFIDVAEDVMPRREQTLSSENKCNLPSKQCSLAAIDDNIWRNIITFAALPSYPIPSNRTELDISDIKRFNSTRKALSLVCKAFEQLVRPLFFEFPLIYSLPALRVFTERILTTPSLGCEVRVMLSNVYRRTQETPDAIREQITWRSGNGHYLMTSEMFALLARVSGNTLLTLTGVYMPDHLSLLPLNSFKCLKMLEIDLTPHDNDCTLLKPGALADLHTLEIYHMGPLSDAFCTLRLPRLRSLSLHGTFAGSAEKLLQSVGGPVTNLQITGGFTDFADVFKLTPNLLRLEWKPHGSLSKNCVTVGEAFSQPVAHAKLRELTLLGVACPRNGEKEQNNVIKTLFSCLDLRKLPSLKEIKFPNYVWPVETRAISRHLLPKEAVRVKQQYGVDITDKSGKPWRPRAQ